MMTQLPEKSAPSQGRSRAKAAGLVVAATAAVALAAGAAFVVGHHHQSATARVMSSPAPFAPHTIIATSDTMPPALAARLLRQWDTATAAPISAPAVPAGQIGAAIASMHLPAAGAAALRAAISAGRVRMVWVFVWDDAAQDGDVISLASAGARVLVPLTNAGTAVALPVETGQPVTLTAVNEGASRPGVTAGVEVGRRQLFVPLLMAGQAVALPVAPE